MALTIDKRKTALLVIDCENDIAHPDGTVAKSMGFGPRVEAMGTIANVRKVLEAARAAKVPVIYITVALDLLPPNEAPRRGSFLVNMPKIASTALQPGTWGGAIHDDLAPAPGEPIIRKCLVSGFARSELAPTLRKLGTTDLILTGVATNMAVESTARDAIDRGYSIITVEDAVNTFSEEAHRASLAMLRMFGDVTPAAEVVAALRG